MPPSAQVVQWMNTNFPKPRVDSEWLEGCTQWLEEDQNISSVTDFPGFMERVKVQLLESDLLDSMQTGTGLDANILTMSGHLRGPPVLVQIMAITDISTSAYQLEQIRAAREERMLAGEGNEEVDGDGDVEVEGEGPLPKYPRGALRFQLSDGQRTIQAMEYRQISAFSLGTTPLGFKLQLKGTKFQDGMAMLEPDTVIPLGGKQSDLEAKQLEDFKCGLHARLGRPLPQPEEARGGVSATAVARARSPLVDIPLPVAPLVQHNDDVDLEPRRRLPAPSSSSSQSSFPSDISDVKETRRTIGLPSRNNNPNIRSTDDKNGDVSQARRSISIPERATLIHAGSQNKTTKATSPYFNGNAVASGSSSKPSENSAINAAVEALDFSLQPTPGQMTHFLPSPERFEPPIHQDDFNFELFDEMDQENQIPPSTSSLHKGKERQHDDRSSDDYGMDDDNDFDNPSFLKEIDSLEKAALRHPPESSTAVPASSSSGVGSNSSLSKPHTAKSSVSASPPKLPRQTQTQTGRSQSYVAPSDVIEIEDSDDEMQELDDKENEPVPTRHVRRRMEQADTAGASRVSSMPTQLSQKTGRPVVLATNPDDIIDLSDSD